MTSVNRSKAGRWRRQLFELEFAQRSKQAYGIKLALDHCNASHCCVCGVRGTPRLRSSAKVIRRRRQVSADLGRARNPSAALDARSLSNGDFLAWVVYQSALTIAQQMDERFACHAIIAPASLVADLRDSLPEPPHEPSDRRVAGMLSVPRIVFTRRHSDTTRPYERKRCVGSLQARVDAGEVAPGCPLRLRTRLICLLPSPPQSPAALRSSLSARAGRRRV
uniref:Uncharacterized protein n=1 Tax=Plectus sambesii TaxID=2011161 RepID=A0A914VI73_9BILA